VVLVAICLTLIGACAAITIDIGLKYIWKTEMQLACDASALAGASGLYRNDGTANVRALNYASKNLVNQSPVSPDEVKVTIGNWSGVRRTFTPATGTQTHTPNALRADAQRNGIPFRIAPVIDKNSTGVGGGATALAGGGTCAGIWGLEGITADGDLVTDSYDSRTGAYGGNNMRPNGDICSCSDIIFNGGVQIRGDAMYGYNHQLIPYGKSYEVWGHVGPHNLDVEAPFIDMAAAAAVNDNSLMPLTARGRSPFMGSGPNLYVTGNDSLTLPGGRFYFTSVLLDGQASVTVTAHTEIYLNGSGLFTGGGIINATGDPKNLVIYSTGNFLQLTGGSAFYGGVVAPRADIMMQGTSTVYGTLLGRTLDFDGNAVIHIDESLVRDIYGIGPIAPILVE
jgi:hypothetical protein